VEALMSVGGDMTRRVGRKAGSARPPAKHTATGDYAHDLTTLAHELAATEAAIRRRVKAARKAGQTWSDIGTCLGVTKQAAQQRYGK
jgi:hypothetical protein